ncbi:MFS transporter [Nonomuraea guangzhouensis]|uniref:MFS transporter n=1 Tax=Nonomuraea guangzhouensis TaxID=1291555 RepID=A0ABW4GX15_9ACTN|nr:MFS transporter [Nonomuraea guangzhouensis]
MRVNRAWLGLIVLTLPTLIVAMDMTALLLALPQLSADLGATNVQQLWISDSYGFMVAGLVITMGTLGDRIGRRRLLMIGGAAFAVLSVVAACATGPLMLIAARTLLGVAGATLAPSTLALITNMFRDERRRGQAIAIWATCQFTGGALGPVLAGFLLEHFWWGSVFLAAVPAMALLLLAGPFLLPEFRSDQAGRLDLASVGLSLVSVLLMVYGIKQLTVESAPVVPAAALVAGAAIGFVFVRRQLRLETPLLDLRLFRNRPFTAVVVALVFAGIAMAGTGLLVTQYLQSVLGFSPVASAVLFAPMGLGVAAGTMAAPTLARRMKQTTAIAGGLVGSALGGLLLVAVDVEGAIALPLVMIGITVLALGTGPLFALGTGLVVGSVPPERAGSAASMSETGNYFGGSLGFALFGVVAAVVYRSGMAGRSLAGTSDSLAGAIAASQRLPADQGAELLHAAREAFTASLHVTGVVAAIIFAGLAVLVLILRPATRITPAAMPDFEATHS